MHQKRNVLDLEDTESDFDSNISTDEAASIDAADQELMEITAPGQKDQALKVLKTLD